jgi:uncharacterized protein YcaQ
VQAASLEPGAPPETLERLERELELTARWLGLDAVERAR